MHKVTNGFVYDLAPHQVEEGAVVDAHDTLSTALGKKP